jgi:hypothetical protein
MLLVSGFLAADCFGTSGFGPPHPAISTTTAKAARTLLIMIGH